MKESLSLIGIAALAIALWFVFMSLWFLRGQSDKILLDSQGVSIKSLQDSTRAKDDLIAKNKELVAEANTKIQALKDSAKGDEVTIAKDESDLNAKDEQIESLKNNIQALAKASAKDKSDLEAKDEAIASLQGTLASYEAQMKKVAEADAQANQGTILERIYPRDDSFEAQDLGGGFSAYQVFGPVKNPNNVPFPDRIPKRSPWEFGDGNSGIAANGSGLYIANAPDQNHDGVSSSCGQAAFLEYQGSWISQSIKLRAGTYSVSFEFEARRDYLPANQVAVSLDDSVLFKGAPTDCNNFASVTTATVILSKAGMHKLKFTALGSIGNVSGYPCVFIDNVVINRLDPKKSAQKKSDAEIKPENNLRTGEPTEIAQNLR